MTATAKYFVADLVEEVGSLPTVAAQIIAMTSDAECDMVELAKVIMCDSVMAMRFLALANSAALARGQEVRELRAAVIRLGLRRVRNVALCMGMHDIMPADDEARRLPMQEFWKFNLATASCAEGLAWLRGAPSDEDAWLAGILHGIGVAVLNQKLNHDFERALKVAQARKADLAAAERTILDFHHGELGSRILSHWGVPRVFADVAAHYPDADTPEGLSDDAARLLDVLRGARAIVRAAGYGDSGDRTVVPGMGELAEQLALPDEFLAGLAAKVDSEVARMSSLLGMDLDGASFAESLEESRRTMVRLGLEGIDNALVREDFEQQMSMAREIQQKLLPAAPPVLERCTIAAENRPSLHVSGDYYDFLDLGGRTAFVVADVSGKGMPAALLASNVQAALKALAGVFSDPGELLKNINNSVFAQTGGEKFVTLFLGVLCPDDCTLRYASAGHNPPLLLRAGGEAEWLKAAGTPLGMVPDMAYPVMEVPLAPGDLLVAYTDGVTEAGDGGEGEFGEDGLEASVRRSGGADPQAVIDAVMDGVARFGAAPASPAAGLVTEADSARRPADDDLTMIVVRIG
jgi:serine phosphatase RsbU (regulator of sigma subunit)/HD-like signal output (HDOD) protein